MSSRLHLPVERRVHTVNGPVAVSAELVNWAGVRLMVHETLQPEEFRDLRWSCSHEPTGCRIATGPSPETALCAAIVKLRANYATFNDQAATKAIINP